MNMLSRATRVMEPTLSLHINLLPREAFGNDAETLDLYDTFVRLRDSMNDHERQAGREKVAAQEATTAYQRKIRDALATGDDTSKIKNETDKHEATSKGHLALSQAARHELTHVARALAHRIAEAAPQHLTTSEVRLTAEAEKMRTALKQLHSTWTRYSAAWQERRVLGNAALFGGAINNYDGSGHLPTNVQEALDTLASHLNDLDRLKQDERIILTEREGQPVVLGNDPESDNATLITV